MESDPQEKLPDEGRQAEEEYPSLPKLLLITIGLCIAIFMVALDDSIIATALPTITSVFNSLDDVGWYGSAYLLTSTSLQPSFGKIYANFNTKAVFLFTLFMFEVGSVICAASINSAMLIAGRAISGAAASGIFTGALCIVSLSVPLHKRPVYIGLTSSMMGVAAIIGPLLGGAFTDKASWRWCFWINLPLGGLAFASVLFLFSYRYQERDTRIRERISQIDLPGAFFLISSVVCLLLGLQWGGIRYPWRSSKVWGLFIGSGLALLVFILVQIRRGERATIPPTIFFQRTVLVSFIFTFLFGMAVYVQLYYIPFYFQAVKGTTAVGSGVRTIPRVIPTVIVNVVVGVLMTATKTYAVFWWLGGAIFTAGAATFCTLDVDTSAGKWIGYQILAGLGTGPCFQVPLFAVQTVLSVEDSSVGMSILIFATHLGASLGVSMANTIFTNALVQNLPEYAPSIDPRLILNAGATQIRDVVPEEALEGVLKVYALALDRAFILPAACGGAAFLASLFVKKVSLKKPYPSLQSTN